MIFAKLLALFSFITSIIFIVNPNEFFSFLLGKNITTAKLKKFFLYNLMACLSGISAIFYFFYHPDKWETIWESWTAVILVCIYLIKLLDNICRYIKKHPNS